MPTKVKRTPIDDIQTVIKNNLFIQYASIIPLVCIFVWLFGFYSAWGSILIVAIGYSIRFVSSQKNLFYGDFTTVTPLTRNKREVQHCAWLNLLILKYWQTCVPKFVEPQIDNVNRILQEKKPGFMKKLEINSWSLGDRAPRITQIYTPIILSDDRYILEFEILFVPDLNVEVHVQPLSFLLMKVIGSELKFKGRMRLTFNFNDLFPECSVISVCFVDNPLIEVSVRPVSKLDFCSVPLVYELIHEITKSNLEPIMIEPNKLRFTLGGGQVETYDTMEKPITDIVLIYSETSKAPPGYVLLQRTASGMLAANLNSGNKGKELYICYKREEGKEPITGVCIIFPDYDIKPPQGFEAILETPSAEPASLNIGNEGTEAFLCISRKPGNPLTGLILVNKNEDYILPEDFRVLELSPTGKSANFNKKAGGDRLFLAFKGGFDSYFGYDIPCKDPTNGLLRVEIVEARNLLAVDLGGTSDPYTEVIIGESEPQKNSPVKLTRVIDKNLAPKWEQNFVFNANISNILTLNVYDKDKIEIDPDHLGRIQLSLKNLVKGKTVDQWIKLQMVNKGELRIRVTALNFGLDPSDNNVVPFEPLEVNKYSNTPLLFNIGGLCGKGIKGVANIGGMGLKGVTNVGGMGLKGVTNVGEFGVKGVTNVGEMGLKGVTNVGEMGLKGVTNVGEMGFKGVTNVGEMGFKGVTNVGEMGVKGVTNVGKGMTDAVGGMFGMKHKKDKKEKKSEHTKESEQTKDTEEHKTKDSGEMSISNVSKGMTDAVGGMFGMKHKKDKKDKKSEHAKEIDENKEYKHEDKKDKHDNEEKHEDEEKGILQSSIGTIGNVFHSKKHDKSKKPKREKSDRHMKLFGKKKQEEHAKEIDENTQQEINEKKQEKSLEQDINSDVPSKQPITREGNLEKLSPGKLHLKSSHKRFCSLQADSFLTYKSKKDQIASKSPIDSFPLGEIRIEEGKDKFCFNIIYKNNTTSFKCSSNEELQIWISSINNNIQCHK